MASALIAVQVALCAVIGFVTFGASHRGTNGHTGSGSLAANAPHLVAPVFPSPSGLSPIGPLISKSPAKRISPKATEQATTVPPEGSVLVAPVPPPVTTKAPLLPPAGAPSRPADTIAPSPRSTLPDGSLPTPGPTGSMQSGAIEDQTCSPKNALGRSPDGSVLVCLPATDGSLHWKTT